jgi:hypothetical protein
MRRAAMQLILAFLEPEPPSLPQTARQDIETTAEARKAAIEIMARILAQTIETTEPAEVCDE